jgi:molybdopterin synthase sulfur carrier subunit
VQLGFAGLGRHNAAMITLLYFARLRESLGVTSEKIALPHGVATLEGVRALLAARGGTWAHELAAGRAFRAAVNQAIASADTPVKEGDEVAFFPPVTGG